MDQQLQGQKLKQLNPPPAPRMIRKREPTHKQLRLGNPVPLITATLTRSNKSNALPSASVTLKKEWNENKIYVI